jgi:hypothetical protein
VGFGAGHFEATGRYAGSCLTKKYSLTAPDPQVINRNIILIITLIFVNIGKYGVIKDDLPQNPPTQSFSEVLTIRSPHVMFAFK